MKTIDCASVLYHIGNHILPTVGENFCKRNNLFQKVLIVTDANVAPLYLAITKASFTACKKEVFSYILPVGEKEKNQENVSDILQTALKNNLSRNDIFVALGGGVVGDICGFCASIYLRGISFIQIPTTLLGAIDSSIGGKNGIDTPFGKNLIGSFWNPEMIFFDTETLHSIPPTEIKNGLGEGYKYAVLHQDCYQSLITEPFDMLTFIMRCVEYKSSIVKDDERDNGIRKLLNLGHTVGHAIECATGYLLPHGECVANGIRILSSALYRKKLITEECFDKLSFLYQKIGFADCDIAPSAWLPYVAHDKKASGNTLTYIAIRDIGHCEIVTTSLSSFGELFL